MSNRRLIMLLCVVAMGYMMGCGFSQRRKAVYAETNAKLSRIDKECLSDDSTCNAMREDARKEQAEKLKSINNEERAEWTSACAAMGAAGRSYANSAKNAQRNDDYQGCCSHHDGISHCGEYDYRVAANRVVCNDGELSPTCTCN